LNILDKYGRFSRQPCDVSDIYDCTGYLFKGCWRSSKGGNVGSDPRLHLRLGQAIRDVVIVIDDPFAIYF
jgi:hypothetical protein